MPGLDVQQAAGFINAFLGRGLGAGTVQGHDQGHDPVDPLDALLLRGFQLSAASFSMLTLPAIQRSTGWPPCVILPPRTNSSNFLQVQFILA